MYAARERDSLGGADCKPVVDIATVTRGAAALLICVRLLYLCLRRRRESARHLVPPAPPVFGRTSDNALRLLLSRLLCVGIEANATA